MEFGKWSLDYLLIFLFLSFFPLIGTALIGWIFKGTVKNQKIMLLVNFLIFLALFIVEIFFLGPDYLKKGLREKMADKNLGERYDPDYVPSINFSMNKW